MSDVNINIKLVTAAAQAQLTQLKTKMDQVDSATTAASKSTQNFGNQLGSVGKIARGVFLGNLIQSALYSIVDAAVDTTFAYAEFEEQLIAVGKTTGIEGQALEDLGEKIEDLSKVIPIASTELLKLSTIAGQLGINAADDIVKFTEVVARLGSAVQGSSPEEFATQLARIANLTGTPIANIDRLASSLVDLGNNVAANEAEISSIALRMAAATKQFNLTAEDILGLSATFAELGISAELAGSASLRIFRSITKAADEGGEALRTYTRLTGLTVEQFQELASESPVEVLELLSSGLNKLTSDSAQYNKTLQVLGLNELRAATAVSGLAGAYDRLAINVDRSADASRENNALTEESNRAFESQLSQLQLMKNEFAEFSKEISQAAAPAITTVISKLRTLGAILSDVAEGFRSTTAAARETSVDENNLSGLNLALALRNKLLDEATQKYRDNQREIVSLQQELDSAIAPQNIARAEELLNNAVKRQGILRQDVNLQQQRVNLIKEQIAAQGSTSTGDGTPPGETSITQAMLYYQQLSEIRLSFLENQKLTDELRLQEENALRDLRLNDDISALEEYYIKVETLRQQDRLDAAKNEEEKQKILQKIGVSAQEKTQDALENIKQKEVKATESALGTISGLMQSSNRELFEIGKAASIARATMAGIEATVNAYRDVPYPFNIAASALVAAATAAQISQIASTPKPSFNNGGIVGGSSFNGDRVDARVNSGEMILNRAQQTNLFNMANGQGLTNGQNNQSQEIVVHTTVNVEGEAVARAVSRQVADGFKLGENI